eukprot:tig00001155_g7311.t1
MPQPEACFTFAPTPPARSLGWRLSAGPPPAAPAVRRTARPPRHAHDAPAPVFECSVTRTRKEKQSPQAEERWRVQPNPETGSYTTQEDGLFPRLFIWLFRKQLAPDVGWKSDKPGFAGLVEECRYMMIQRGPEEQREAVKKMLASIFFPPYGTAISRRIASVTPPRWAARLNAVVTPVFCSWLVGECERNEAPDGGEGVLIKKCRFLEESGCKGLCVNMCKLPTTSFFTDVLGVPLKMTPDFETYECQMSFGVRPDPPEEDPALVAGCLASCPVRGVYGEGEGQVVRGSNLLWTPNGPVDADGKPVMPGDRRFVSCTSEGRSTPSASPRPAAP